MNDGLWNNVVCELKLDGSLTKNVYERYVLLWRLSPPWASPHRLSPPCPPLASAHASPEFFRYQMYSPNLIDSMSGGAEGWSLFMGELLSTGLTTFLHMPTSAHVSLSMAVFFPPHGSGAELAGPLHLSSPEESAALYSMQNHPVGPYLDFESKLLRYNTRTPSGSTKVSIRPLVPDGLGLPLVRCDIVNMTRHVHHQ